MALFLTQEWVDELNDALSGASVPGPGPEDSLTAAEGRFTVVQEVQGAPGGDRRLVLHVDGESLRFELAPPAEPSAPNVAPEDTGGRAPGPEVTIAVDYEDAAALARGELTPAEALGAGRIRVRGDLSVLVAAQRMLEAARPATAGVASSTTY